MKQIHARQALGAALVAALGVLSAGGARADVRLHEDGGGPDEPGLAIRLSPAGPWSLVGPLDATVLNPAGDSFGDGLPSDAPQGETLLAGWTRPGDGFLHLSRWCGAEWQPLQPFADESSIGVPRVDALGTGWAVTWQQLPETPIIRAGGVGADGEHRDSEPIIHGWLVDSTWMDDIQLVLHEDPERERLFLTGVLWAVPSVPSPVDIVFSVELGPIDGDDLGNGSPMASFSPVQKPGGDGTKVLRGAWSRRMVVTWFNAEGTLEQAIVDEDGDVRHLGKPRYEAGNGLSGRLIGSP